MKGERCSIEVVQRKDLFARIEGLQDYICFSVWKKIEEKLDWNKEVLLESHHGYDARKILTSVDMKKKILQGLFGKRLN